MNDCAVERIIFSAEQINRRVAELAARLASDYPPGELATVAVLKGSFIFVADLARQLSAHDVHLAIDFLTLASYGRGSVSPGRVRIEEDSVLDVRDRDVLLVDDILDTGRTLRTAVDLLRGRGAKSVRTCVLLDKAARRQVDIQADYVGFPCPDVFVVGYGLDYAGRFRELPNVGAISVPGQ